MAISVVLQWNHNSYIQKIVVKSITKLSINQFIIKMCSFSAKIFLNEIKQMNSSKQINIIKIEFTIVWIIINGLSNYTLCNKICTILMS